MLPRQDIFTCTLQDLAEPPWRAATLDPREVEKAKAVQKEDFP